MYGQCGFRRPRGPLQETAERCNATLKSYQSIWSRVVLVVAALFRSKHVSLLLRFLWLDTGHSDMIISNALHRNTSVTISIAQMSTPWKYPSYCILETIHLNTLGNAYIENFHPSILFSIEWEISNSNEQYWFTVFWSITWCCYSHLEISLREVCSFR